MIGLNFTIIGATKLISTLTSSRVIKGPLDKGIRKITFKYEALVKKATVVDTGRLRSSIHSEFNPMRASVGTNVFYAPFVEYGTQRMAARHVEGSSPERIKGEGMFRYAWGLLLKWLDKGDHNIHVEIDREFK